MKKFYFMLVILLICQMAFAQLDIEFSSLSDMNTARYGLAYANDGNYLYAICGGTFEPPNYLINNIERYNPATDTWIEFVNDLIPRRYCRAEYLQETNKIYIFGGYVSTPSTYTDTVEVVDVNNGNITYINSNPIPNAHSGTAVWNNKIYIFGGSHNGYSNELYEFDPINYVWNQLANMPEAKQTEGEVVNGILYVFGGYTGTVSNRIDAYDIQNNEWSLIGYMPLGISAHHTTVSGQYIWLLGGYDNLESVAVFNTETHEFTQLNTNMIGRRHCATEVIGNNLYVYGGNITTYGPALSSLQYADISDYTVSSDNIQVQSLSKNLLYQNLPNPFNPSTIISFSIIENSNIELSIFSIKGQKIKILAQNEFTKGNHSLIWNGDDVSGKEVSSGIYYYKLNVNGKTETVKKCLLLK
ncbi:MAG: T9SS type A sorting domain-containing protein [Melioribacteraceae bacterium]|nr:T9SS type A sorting domain-containing protein [Melioribacteraceae bacterium]